MPRVPTTTDVVPGALVNIVLKADQPTGRTVLGTVATLLTRGNHPRGIKVRLADGRVGRVQSMAAPASAAERAGEREPSAQTATVPVVATSHSAHGRRSRPVPEMEYERPPQSIDLGAYIAQPRKRGKGKGANRGRNQESLPGDRAEMEQRGCSSEVVTCPVCGAFEGDEAAVAHHVSSHFGD
ncbi:hypothetical protein BJX61DRAFT_516003 [Aspergillus egyptiacus]|nr:hypothetical protein BJX61DRAFT_516003 [Aspergillus egyptiacus]